MKTSTSYIFVCLLLAILGCTADSLPPSTFMKWVGDPSHGLVQTVETEELEFALQYKPLAYLALQELGPQDLSAAAFEKARAEYQGMEYYGLKIRSKKGETSLTAYRQEEGETDLERVQYLAFELQDDIKLLVANDTLDCGLYHFEQYGQLAPFVSFFLGFETPDELKGDRTLIWNDRVFSQKEIRFYFKENALNRIPNIAL